MVVDADVVVEIGRGAPPLADDEPLHDPLPSEPPPVAIAERRVPKPLRVRLQVLEVQELERRRDRARRVTRRR
jgi:hypothetical protein